MSNEVVNITINDNSDEIKKLFDKAAERGLEAIGMTAEGYAKETIQQSDRVDTGAMMNSVAHAVKDNAAYVGSNLKYFVYHELGTGIHASDGQGRKEPWFYVDEEGKGHITSGVKPLHALKKAASEHTDEYKKLLEDYLENDCKMKEVYKIRADSFYKYNDKNNCKRIYDYILNMKY